MADKKVVNFLFTVSAVSGVLLFWWLGIGGAQWLNATVGESTSALLGNLFFMGFFSPLIYYMFDF